MSEVKPSAISWKFRTPVGAPYSEIGALARLATTAHTLTIVRAVISNAGKNVAPEKAPEAGAAAAGRRERPAATKSWASTAGGSRPRLCCRSVDTPAAAGARTVADKKAEVWCPTKSAAAKASKHGSSKEFPRAILLVVEGTVL
eukprot:CAMPEP_0115611582 /NCGR_PEP_ID=MMETSP0272-20121206/20606_1 /TAXON_ID=71861 /ORGANISM="Scrippsiella trochoidea, Strain CCMP3099" /LENGTH=143 /DNA_ID=CAMNT_0003047317 /DNA_START=37 /DNA_END=468 /DNA_ORIENTATION=+